MMTADLTLWRWLGALILVLVLMGGLVLLLQHFGPHMVRRRKGFKSELAIRDSMAIDPRRRLLVIGWKDKEYLLLLSPQGEQLIAQNDGKKTLPALVKKRPAPKKVKK